MHLLLPRVLAAVLLLATLPACAGTRPVPPPAGPLPDGVRYGGGLILDPPDEGFGGLSDLRFDGAPDRLVAVSDRGMAVRMRLTRDAAGRPTGLAAVNLTRLRDPAGTPLAGDHRDAEGLARDGRGGWLVSFEHAHRIERFAVDFSPQGSVPGPEALDSAPIHNKGLEVLTRLGPRHWLLIAEHIPAGPGLTRGWIGRPGDWKPLTYRARAGLEPTAAAALPGGDLLVVERRFTLLTGLTVRVARVPADRVKAGGTLEGPTLFAIPSGPAMDNFEGIAVRPLADGGTEVLLLSDDNFNALQNTILLRHVLTR